GLWPSAAVVVATVRAIKYHGGVDVRELDHENPRALGKGLSNLERHVDVRNVYGVPCVVAINRFAFDTAAELDAVRARMAALGVPVVTANHWAEGGRGAIELASEVVALCEQPVRPAFVYD